MKPASTAPAPIGLASLAVVWKPNFSWLGAAMGAVAATLLDPACLVPDQGAAAGPFPQQSIALRAQDRSAGSSNRGGNIARCARRGKENRMVRPFQTRLKFGPE